MQKWAVSAYALVKANIVAIAVVLALGVSSVVMGGCGSKGKNKQASSSSSKKK